MIKQFLILIIAIVLTAAGTWYFANTFRPNAAAQPNAQNPQCQYKNINPNRCEPESTRNEKEYTLLRNDLNDYFTAKVQSGDLKKISVYFRDLRNGPVMSINAQDQYIPASLLKLPFMIMVYKKAQTNPAILSQQIKITSKITTFDQNIPPDRTAQPGGTYTVEQLVNLLITQSDNSSWEVLNEYFAAHNQENDFVDTLSDLGIVDPTKQLSDQFITAQIYASIFRILYNASYLNPQMSDKALTLLSQSSFKDGLVAGLPADMQVAHKFGERKENGVQQLHDCGIVYYPQNPYMLCVMTSGTSNEVLEPIIKEVSQQVYNAVKQRN